ncbi:hypothetical protein BG74_06520 [Sodalis-like endosymbiont of Proechinophthirus fluctus]|nr:hypothetical protein BG74_06520 [Sodalis-like endosymbiont of Proechinophthirus fluctus]
MLIQDQNETIVYVDKFGEIQGLVEEDANFIEKKDELMKGEALLYESDSMKEAIINSDFVGDETFSIDNDEGEISSAKSKNEMNGSKENLTENLFDNNNHKMINESEIYLNCQMIKLADGTTAFVENSKSGKNDVYTPIRLYNGSIIYVVSGTLLSNNLDGANSCENVEQVEKAESVVTEQKQEKSKGFQCSYKNCNKSYTSFHHLKVQKRIDFKPCLSDQASF